MDKATFRIGDRVMVMFAPQYVGTVAQLNGDGSVSVTTTSARGWPYHPQDLRLVEEAPPTTTSEIGGTGAYSP